MTQGSQRGRTLLILLGILLLAFVLRSLNLDRGLWSDEIATFRGADQSFYMTLVHRIFPVYYLICHAILYVTDAAWALRLPSVLFGVAGCAVIYVMGRKLAGDAAGLTAAALLALSPFHILHSEDARYYALLILMGLITMLLAWRALASRSWDDVPWMLVAGNLFVLCHPFAVPTEFALGVGAAGWLLWDMRRETWTVRIKALLSVAAVTLAAGLMFWISGWASEFPMVVRIISHRVAALGAPLLTVLGLGMLLAIGWGLWALRRGVSPAQAHFLERLAAILLCVVLLAAAVWLVYFQLRVAGKEIPEPPYRVLRQIPDDYIEDYEGLVPLTPSQAWTIVREGFFGEWGPIVTLLTLLFAGAGLVGVWRMGGPAPWLLSAVLFVMPLPFFMVPFAHRMGPQYFAMQFVVIILLAAIGLAWAVSAVPRLLAGGEEVPRTKAFRGGLVVLLVLAVLPAALGSLGRIAEGSIFGRRDYGAFARLLAKEMRGHDVLASLIPADAPWTTYRQAEFTTSFAVGRVFENPKPYFHAPRYNEVTSAERLSQIRAAHPYAKVFAFCGEDEPLDPALRQALERADAQVFRFAALRVWQIRPQTEPSAMPPGFRGPLNANGGLEDSVPGEGLPAGWTEVMDLEANAAVVSDFAKEGQRALRLTAPAGDQANIGAAYTGEVSLPGRGALFSAWLYAPEPRRTYLQIVDSRQDYHNRMPVRSNEWEFVVVRARISEESEEQAFAVTLHRTNFEGEVIIDDAQILLESADAPAPPPWDPASAAGLVPDRLLRGKRPQPPVSRFSTF